MMCVPVSDMPASLSVFVWMHVCVCLCRLEELWRVGFMSQQVTDDQIN